MRQTGYLILALGATLTSGLAGQVPDSLALVYRERALPDYGVEIARSGLTSIRMPAQPAPVPGLGVVHHVSEVPDYAASFRAPEPRPVPIPPPPPGQTPAVVRGVYLNAWVFGSSRFYDLVQLADSTEVNAFVIDVKDATGYLSYRSGVPTAMEIGANNMVRAADGRARIQLLREHGIHPIARIVVARDPLLARHKPEWAVRDVNGGLWHDALGEAWVDAYNDSVWAYAADLAAEAVLLGFNEVQFDYVRFPDEPPARLQRAVFPGRRGKESKRQAIGRNAALLKQRIGALGVPFTVDVFGLTTSANGDMGIGQNWDDLSRLANVMLPMVYPSHYPRGSYGFVNPNRQPYAIVRRALEDALQRPNAGPAQIRPYLQAFSIYGVRYGATEIREQIQAVEDLGLTDWIVWNARGVYPVGAFRSSDLSATRADPAASGSRER